jgi:hypothetical protein
MEGVLHHRQCLCRLQALRNVAGSRDAVPKRLLAPAARLKQPPWQSLAQNGASPAACRKPLYSTLRAVSSVCAASGEATSASSATAAGVIGNGGAPDAKTQSSAALPAPAAPAQSGVPASGLGSILSVPAASAKQNAKKQTDRIKTTRGAILTQPEILQALKQKQDEKKAKEADREKKKAERLEKKQAKSQTNAKGRAPTRKRKAPVPKEEETGTFARCFFRSKHFLLFCSPAEEDDSDHGRYHVEDDSDDTEGDVKKAIALSMQDDRAEVKEVSADGGARAQTPASKRRRRAPDRADFVPI